MVSSPAALTRRWTTPLQVPPLDLSPTKRKQATCVAKSRQLALSVIRHHGSSKVSWRRRKLCASLNNDYRAQLIFIPQQTERP